MAEDWAGVNRQSPVIQIFMFSEVPCERFRLGATRFCVQNR